MRQSHRVDRYRIAGDAGSHPDGVSVRRNARAARGLVEAVIDTGAAISLAPRAWLETHAGQPVEHCREFHLSTSGWVEFDTPLYPVVVEIDGQPRTLRMGRVPDDFAATMLEVAGTAFLWG